MFPTKPLIPCPDASRPRYQPVRRPFLLYFPRERNLRSPEALGQGTAPRGARLALEATTYRINQFCCHLSSFSSTEQKSQSTRSLVPSINMFGCFSPRLTLTVIGSGTWNKKARALTEPATKGPAPFTEKPLNKHNRPKLCKCQGFRSHWLPCPWRPVPRILPLRPQRTCAGRQEAGILAPPPRPHHPPASLPCLSPHPLLPHPHRSQEGVGRRSRAALVGSATAKRLPKHIRWLRTPQLMASCVQCTPWVFLRRKLS